MDKERADDYLRRLGATRPIIVDGVLAAAERVSSGETPLAISYLKYVIVFGQKGAPIDYARMDKMLGHTATPSPSAAGRSIRTPARP